MVGVRTRLTIVAALICAGACSRQISETEARQRAFQYALGELSMVEPRSQDIRIVEKARRYEVTYSPKGPKAFGGPVTIAVSKRTGEPRLLT